MNFFQSLFALNAAGDWKIIVSKTGQGTLAVSVLLFNDECKDDALNLIPPLVIRGTPQEIDEGFFPSIAAPVETVSNLLVNVLAHQQQVEKAKAQSKMEKDNQARAEKEKTEKQKKYDEGMKKAAELEAEGKHREAWMKVPDPADYPEKAEELKARKTSLAKLFAPDLFNA